MEFLQQLLPIIIYSLLCVLIVVIIILLINVIITLKHANKLLEDIENKSKKLDGIFNAIDSVSSSFTGIGDKIVKFASKAFKNFSKRKRKEEDLEDE